VFALHSEQVLSQISLALEQAPVKLALEGFFHVLITSMTTGTPTRGCFSTKSALAGATIETPIREALQGLIKGIEQRLTQRLQQPETQSAIRLPAAQAAQLISTFTRGLVAIERIYQDPVRLYADANSLLQVLLKSAK